MSLNDKLLERLQFLFDDSYNYFLESWKNRFYKKQINEKLFMGSGFHSKIMCNKFHQKLSYAFSILSGMQQNGGMGSDFDTESDLEDKNSLKEIFLDLMTAFNLSLEDLTQ